MSYQNTLEEIIRECHVRVLLAIAHRDIISGLVEFDLFGLDYQGLDFRIELPPLDTGRLVKHFLEPRVSQSFVKIRSQPVFQIAGFADVQYLARGAFEEIHAGSGWDFIWLMYNHSKIYYHVF